MYSQGEEEKIILEAVAGIEFGYVLDIGAGDGALYSNSRALLEKKWEGLLIEADFEPFAKLFERYKERDKVAMVNAALDMRDGVIDFWKAKPEEQGLCSTTTDRNATIWKGHFAGKYLVGTITPGQLQNQFPRVPDVISVDVEGCSVDVFTALAKEWHPAIKVACVEHDGRAVELGQWGLDRGFKTAYLSQENIILVRK